MKNTYKLTLILMIVALIVSGFCISQVSSQTVVNPLNGIQIQVGEEGKLPLPPGAGSIPGSQQIGGNIQMPVPPSIGGGTGTQQIGGGLNGQLPDPPNPGGGSGGQQIGGGGNQLPDPPNPGGGNGGQQIGGGDTIPQPPNPGGGGGLPMGTVVHNISIPTGWSGISSFVIPHLAELDSIFSQDLLNNNLVILQHFNQVFWPAFNINTIGNWDSHDGYTIKVLQETQLNLTGFPELNDTIQFTEGWNYLPVISESEVITENLFSDLTANSQLIIVYEIAGTGIYSPQFGINTLPVLQPGKAYMAKVSEPCSLSFPQCATGEVNIPVANSVVPNSPWDVVPPTPKQQFIFFTQTIPAFQPGDILGGFTRDGLCCGITEFAKSVQNHVLVVFGDDPTTIQKDGFAAGEEIRIRIYRPSNGESYDLDVTFSNDEKNPSGSFVVNGISIVNEIRTLE